MPQQYKVLIAHFMSLQEVAINFIIVSETKFNKIIT